MADWEHNMRWLLSSKIKKVYVNHIISEYADGGFSSTHDDSVFLREKILKYLLHGKSELKVSVKIFLLFKELKRTAVADQRTCLKIALNIPKIIFGARE